jgi:hypothetical protein
MFHIYHLVDPRDAKVRYVGMTRNPKSRFRSHIAEAHERDNTDKKRWIRELLAAGMQPVLAIVGNAPTELEARAIESHECKRNLATIFNVHDPRKGSGDIRKETKHEQQ